MHRENITYKGQTLVALRISKTELVTAAVNYSNNFEIEKVGKKIVILEHSVPCHFKHG